MDHIFEIIYYQKVYKSMNLIASFDFEEQWFSTYAFHWWQIIQEFPTSYLQAIPLDGNLIPLVFGGLVVEKVAKRLDGR